MSSEISSAGTAGSTEDVLSANKGSTFAGARNPEEISVIVFESGDGAQTRNIAIVSSAVGFKVSSPFMCF